MKIPKKYTKSGSPSQISKMKNEIKKFKGAKGAKGYHQWTGDTDPKTGKPYKTKPSKATLAYQKKFGKKK